VLTVLANGVWITGFRRLTILVLSRFLLAKLHLDLLSHYKDRALLKRALGYLPENLGEAYGEAMKQVVSLHPTATRYIYWVLYAARPLTVTELRSAVGESETIEISRPMSFEHSLLVKTAGLLAVDAVSGTVRFVHRTAKEYLDGSAARVFFPTAQRDMAEACLTAISCDDVIDDCYRNIAGLSRPPKKGFLDYAATYWGEHSRQVDEEEMTVQVLIKTFLNKLLWRRPPLNYAAEKAKGVPTELGIGKYPTDWSGLHVLSFFGIPGKARRLIEQGSNINGQDNSLGLSPLHCAALRGNDEMIAFLLDSGAKENAVSADGKTALHLATERGYRKCMKLLFAHRADSKIADRTGATCLHAAVGTATDESTVPLLVKHKVDLNFQNTKTGNTALHLAVQWQRPRIILFLLERGANIDIGNNEGMTPLQLAANTDNCEAVSLLLQRCAHVEARSLAGPTALQYAAWKGHWTAFDLLLIGGADINVWNKQGETLLHEQAQYSKSISIASKLLDGGANIEARTSQGNTPLQCAAMGANKTMFNFLLEKDAKIDVETAKGETLLHITPPANQDCLDILGTALKEGMSVAATSSQGWTPLHQTVYTGTGAPDLASDRTAEYIQLLISHGASVNDCSASKYAETPLHLAAMAPLPRPSLVEFLIQQGANINAATTEGKTALHLAAERGREPIFRILLDAGADLSVKIPTENNSIMSMESKETPLTAFELAKKNPFGSLWFDDEGKLRPKAQRSGRDSATTVFEDMGSDICESDMGRSEMARSDMARSEAGESATLVGSENNSIITA
jgi:ankyrin repeat protein